MTDTIYLSSPDVGEREQAFVLAAMRSGWIAPLGPDVDAFESEIAARVGMRHGVALSSGTAGLHLGLLALGVGRGDIVITSTMTFVATANAITYTGAEPYFIDSEPDSGNIDPELLRTALTDLRTRGERVAAIVPVDLLGRAVDYSAIESIAAEFGVPVLADAAESFGASHRGRPAGSFGAASVISFNGNKVMTTSGGGMLLTDDDGIAGHVRSLATQAREPTPHYEHREVGFNYRMSNLLAALGRAQLERLDSMIRRRREIRGLYRDAFADVPGVRFLGGDADADDNCWLTSILVEPSGAGWDARSLGSALGLEHIESRPLWKPMHLQPVFANHRASINGTAQRLFEQGLTLPSGSVLDEAAMRRVTEAIRAFLAGQR